MVSAPPMTAGETLPSRGPIEVSKENGMHILVTGGRVAPAGRHQRPFPEMARK
jgi:hypothetical protein